VYGVMIGALILGFVQNLGIFVDFEKIVNLGGLFHIVDHFHHSG